MKILLLTVQVTVMIYLMACEGNEKQSDTGYSKGSKETYQLSQSIDTPKSSKNATPTDDSEGPRNEVSANQDLTLTMRTESELRKIEYQQLYVKEKNVHIREYPNQHAKSITICEMGDSFFPIQRTAKKVKVGRYRDYWYKSAMGWVYGAHITKVISKIKLPYTVSLPNSFNYLIGKGWGDPWRQMCTTTISFTDRTISFSVVSSYDVYHIIDVKRLSRNKYKIKTQYLPLIQSEDVYDETKNFLVTLEPDKKRVIVDGVINYRWINKLPKVYKDICCGSMWTGEKSFAYLSHQYLFTAGGKYGFTDVKMLSERQIMIEAVEIKNPETVKRYFAKLERFIITVAKGNKAITITSSLFGDRIINMKEVK